MAERIVTLGLVTLSFVTLAACAGRVADVEGDDPSLSAAPFPTGVYAIDIVTVAHDCGALQEVGSARFGVHVDDERVRARVVAPNLDDDPNFTIEAWAMQDFSRGGALEGPPLSSELRCADESSSTRTLHAFIVDATAETFSIDVTYDFTGGATCSPIPADGCSVVRRQDFSLLERCASADLQLSLDGREDVCGSPS